MSKIDSNKGNKLRRGKLNELLTQAGNGKTPAADQKQNIKIAFAEGYMAASSDGEPGYFSKITKVKYENWFSCVMTANTNILYIRFYLLSKCRSHRAFLQRVSP